MNKQKHINYIEKKSEETRKLYEFQMLGTGMFSDFDTIKEKARRLKFGK